MHKQLRFSVYVFFLLTAVVAQSQDLANAGSYMGFIGGQHREITKDFLSYSSAVGHGKSARKIENRRKELLKTVNEARQKVGGMAAFSGDRTLRDSTAKYYLITYHILNDDYGKIVNLEEVAEQSYDAMEAYLLAQDLANAKLEQANERLRATEKAFAEKHKVQLTEAENDEISIKAKKVGKINEYYRKIYLTFFKSFKQEVYLMDAIQKKNVNAIEQNKNTLQKYAEEGIAKLKETPAIFSDNTLENGCRQALEFYAAECKSIIPVMTNFYLKEENFMKIKAAFDAKRERDRTQADIDQYNKAANEINKASGEFNNAVNRLNDGRKKAVDGWDKASETFLDKHTPKYR